MQYKSFEVELITYNSNFVLKKTKNSTFFYKFKAPSPP